jgi:hypothetical protein
VSIREELVHLNRAIRGARKMMRAILKQVPKEFRSKVAKAACSQHQWYRANQESHDYWGDTMERRVRGVLNSYHDTLGALRKELARQEGPGDTAMMRHWNRSVGAIYALIPSRYCAIPSYDEHKRKGWLFKPTTYEYMADRGVRDGFLWVSPAWYQSVHLHGVATPAKGNLTLSAEIVRREDDMTMYVAQVLSFKTKKVTEQWLIKSQEGVLFVGASARQALNKWEASVAHKVAAAMHLGDKPPSD